MKRTNYKTYEYGKLRAVYKDENGRLFYKFEGQWMGTFLYRCYDKNGHKVMEDK